MKKFKFLLILFVLTLFVPISAKAENVVNLYLFYGDGCPHCAEEEKFFDEYLADTKNVVLNKYEVWHSKENQELLVKVQDRLNNHSNGVPFLVVGDKVVLGYMDGVTNETIKKYVENYKKDKKYKDVVKTVLNKEKEEPDKIVGTDEKVEQIDVPILGKVNAKKVSLPLLSVVLGFVDGFNPCAMWILIFLITMLINSKDRKKMWILGLTFIITSGIVYLMFMLTWLNLAMFISKLSIIRVLIALISFIVGFINLKKYYESTKKDDGCDVVDKKERKKIMNKIMNIINEKSFIIALGGIILLAGSVNIIELMCSIGLPLIFTQVLAMNNLSLVSYIFYMFLYILFFLIDDIVVFAIAMITSKVTGISTKYSKYSHLIAGIIIVLIGILLLIKPSILMFNF